MGKIELIDRDEVVNWADGKWIHFVAEGTNDGTISISKICDEDKARFYKNGELVFEGTSKECWEKWDDAQRRID